MVVVVRTLLGCEPKSECVRTGVLGITFTLVALVAIIQAIRTACVPTDRLRFQVGVLGLAAIQGSIASVHYLFSSSYLTRFLIIYFQLVLVTFVTYHYARLALRVHTKSERLNRTFLLPSLIVVLVYLSVVLIVAAFANAHVSTSACDDPAWITFSVSGFALTVIFAISGYVINRRFHSLKARSKSMSDSNKRRDLWVLILVNVCSSTVQLAYNLYLSSQKGLCDRLFDAQGTVYLTLTILSRIVVVVFPMVALIAVFRDIPGGAGTLSSIHNSGRRDKSLAFVDGGKALANPAIPVDFLGRTQVPLLDHSGSAAQGSAPFLAQGSMSYLAQQGLLGLSLNSVGGRAPNLSYSGNLNSLYSSTTERPQDKV